MTMGGGQKKSTRPLKIQQKKSLKTQKNLSLGKRTPLSSSHYEIQDFDDNDSLCSPATIRKQLKGQAEAEIEQKTLKQFESILYSEHTPAHIIDRLRTYYEETGKPIEQVST